MDAHTKARLKKLQERIKCLKFMQSRIHKKERMQLFQQTLVVRDFMHSFKILKGKPYCILGCAEISAQTRFGKLFPEPHPRMKLEVLLFWRWDNRTLNFSVKLNSFDDARHNVRYCLESYISDDTTLENAKWMSLCYFGDITELILMEDAPFIMWTWYVDINTLNLTTPSGKPIGNLSDFLDNGNLRLELNLLAVATTGIIARLKREEKILGAFTHPFYTELKGNRFLGPLTMLYQEYAYYDLRIFSVDRKAFFLVDSEILQRYSKSLEASFKHHNEHRYHTKQICSLELDLVTTDGLRIILFYLYHHKFYPGWNELAFEVLLSLIHLGMFSILRFFVFDLYETYGVSSVGMNVIWMQVLTFSEATKKHVREYKQRTHAILHPGLPCDPFCGGLPYY